mmetsp:Transcript_16296/g.24007  ORF Transcript_16296/g.24007 Transcript_16296/m.24007 type:complete len:336 (-) Transcript_16296:238-1245(-)|eukprot:CAMPEP_0116025948 /NCGR_PEP_ID=MMETSP0321-20121206/13468_1 /TAXON_ID=163516 /ORGANISM="Leptocylindrus danicus var. danicus, Strain B650" /LENGTH=335 /DNA_ID=CAMNT_0003498471 /DNA_START=45 /DNA_END=1055 /DNA_ORIENTATION=+
MKGSLTIATSLLFTDFTSAYTVVPLRSSRRAQPLFAVARDEKKISSSVTPVLSPRKDDNEDATIDDTKALSLGSRFNTMERAFGSDSEYKLSSRLLVGVVGGVMALKWFRATFSTKRGTNMLSPMPTFGYLVNSKEEELKYLHAYCCKQCGTTIFPARGRDFKFFPKNIECFNCGAKGRESFYDRRKDMDIGDDVEYLSKYDYMSDAEKKIEKLKERNEKLAEEAAEKAKKDAEEDAWLTEIAADMNTNGDDGAVEESINEDEVEDEDEADEESEEVAAVASVEESAEEAETETEAEVEEEEAAESPAEAETEPGIVSSTADDGAAVDDFDFDAL